MSAAADPRVVQLAEMRESAYRLGRAFAAQAEQAADTKTKVEFFHLFDRCFFSVRVAIALELRLERTPAAKPERGTASDRENLHDREDLADRDPPDRSDRYDERDRDREVERASFPILVRALEGVAADAARLPGPEPAELPTLRELLAHVRPEPAPSPAAPTPRTRLAASGAASGVAPQRRAASNVGEILAARRATGPPRR